MTSTIERRVEALESAGGDGECPRCSGVVDVHMNGERSWTVRDGEPISAEELAEFPIQDEDGKCPVCGARGLEVTVP